MIKKIFILSFFLVLPALAFGQDSLYFSQENDGWFFYRMEKNGTKEKIRCYTIFHSILAPKVCHKASYKDTVWSLDLLGAKAAGKIYRTQASYVPEEKKTYSCRWEAKPDPENDRPKKFLPLQKDNENFFASLIVFGFLALITGWSIGTNKRVWFGSYFALFFIDLFWGVTGTSVITKGYNLSKEFLTILLSQIVFVFILSGLAFAVTRLSLSRRRKK